MKLTAKTDYSLRVIVYVLTADRRVKIKSIAQAYSISKNHLNVVVNNLVELGYLVSEPGPSGGIAVNPGMENVSVGKLVREVENCELVECFNPETNQCILGSGCSLKRMLQEASEAFISCLDQYTLKDLKNRSVSKVLAQLI